MTKIKDSELTEHSHFYCGEAGALFKPGRCAVKSRCFSTEGLFSCQCFGHDYSHYSPSWYEGERKMSLTEMIEEISNYRQKQLTLQKAYYKDRGIKPQKYNGYAMAKAMKGKPLVCVKCGDTRMHLLQRHHIDGDVGNNTTDNLEWRCLRCHTWH